MFAGWCRQAEIGTKREKRTETPAFPIPPSNLPLSQTHAAHSPCVTIARCIPSSAPRPADDGCPKQGPPGLGVFSRGQTNSLIADNNDFFPCIKQGAQTRAKSACRRKEPQATTFRQSPPHSPGRQTGQSVTPILRSGSIGSLADAKSRYPKHRFPGSPRTTA